jgi:aminoglycoside phosphotransferase
MIARELLPDCLAEAVSDYRWQEIFTGCSTARVFRLSKHDGSCLYLKTAYHAPDRLLLQEKLRLEWLQGQLPVPQVKMFVEDNNGDHLLLSAIPGTVASDAAYKTNVPKLIEHLSTGLRMIHALPIDRCPFDATLPTKIELARKRVADGLVDESDFDQSRLGRTAADLFAKLLEAVPNDEDLVFTHGDYCLPNIILQEWRLSGFIDWGRAGVADRYQDIALIARSVESNFGYQWVSVLFEACGIKPDHAKVRFYTLLDEFF